MYDISTHHCLPDRTPKDRAPSQQYSQLFVGFGTNQHPTRNQASHVAKEQYPKEQQRHHNSGLFEYRGCKYCSLVAKQNPNFSGSWRSMGYETIKLSMCIYLAKLQYFTNLDFLEIRGFPLQSPPFGGKLVVWGRERKLSLSLFHLFWRHPCLAGASNLVPNLERYLVFGTVPSTYIPWVILVVYSNRDAYSGVL